MEVSSLFHRSTQVVGLGVSLLHLHFSTTFNISASLSYCSPYGREQSNIHPASRRRCLGWHKARSGSVNKVGPTPKPNGPTWNLLRLRQTNVTVLSSRNNVQHFWYIRLRGRYSIRSVAALLPSAAYRRTLIAIFCAEQELYHAQANNLVARPDFIV